MFARYLPSGFLQIPVRSGLPSGVFGTGAVRLGFPSGVRGVFGSGTFTHWRTRIAIAVAVKFIGICGDGSTFLAGLQRLRSGSPQGDVLLVDVLRQLERPR